MKQIISILLMMAMLFALCACGGRQKCRVCGGSGYYEKRLAFFVVGRDIRPTTLTSKKSGTCIMRVPDFLWYHTGGYDIIASIRLQV